MTMLVEIKISKMIKNKNLCTCIMNSSDLLKTSTRR